MFRKPKIGVTYIFLRRDGDTTEEVEFVRWEDGSANIVGIDSESVYEGVEDAWVLALADLERDGFQLAGRKNSN
jgi:hypothetical protein